MNILNCNAASDPLYPARTEEFRMDVYEREFDTHCDLAHAFVQQYLAASFAFTPEERTDVLVPLVYVARDALVSVSPRESMTEALGALGRSFATFARTESTTSRIRSMCDLGTGIGVRVLNSYALQARTGNTAEKVFTLSADDFCAVLTSVFSAVIAQRSLRTDQVASAARLALARALRISTAPRGSTDSSTAESRS